MSAPFFNVGVGGPEAQSVHDGVSGTSQQSGCCGNKEQHGKTGGGHAVSTPFQVTGAFGPSCRSTDEATSVACIWLVGIKGFLQSLEIDLCRYGVPPDTALIPAT